MKKFSKLFFVFTLLAVASLTLGGCSFPFFTTITEEPAESTPQEERFELAQTAGYEETYEEWLASIRGEDGKDGQDGINGLDGLNGKDGRDGADGSDGKDGLDGEDGMPGEKGETGPQGEKGDNGEKGETGLQGEKGTDGSVWHNSSGRPDNALGRNGDYHLDIETADISFKNDGEWTFLFNLKGIGKDES